MLKTKYQRFWQFQYELVHDYELTCQQGVVYAYLYNHCININDNGYCGYSDERMAKELKIHERTLRRELKVLRDKGLIIVKNPQKRSKRTGESRMFYINADVYISQQLDLTDVQNDNLRRENERLRQQNEELEKLIEEQRRSVQISHLGLKLVKQGFMSGEDYMVECQFYNTILQKFLEDSDYEWVMKSFAYFTSKKASEVKDYPSYLASCIKSSMNHYCYQNQFEE